MLRERETRRRRRAGAGTGRRAGGPRPPVVAAAARRPLVRRARGRHHPRVRVRAHPLLPRAPAPAGSSSAWRTSCAPDRTAHGAWSGFPGGPPEVSASTKAYLVLKLAGDDPAAPHMRAARAAILERGGLDACNSYTRLLLSMFGVYEWDKAPAVPPEIVLLPRWFYFNIYEMSSWSRAIVVPLSILWASKPSCELPATCRLDELRARGVACGTVAARGAERARALLARLLPRHRRTDQGDRGARAGAVPRPRARLAPSVG